MSNMTLDSNPLHRLASMGSKPIDKPKDPSLTITETPPVENDDHHFVDRFEQARIAFFSK
jgi:hypothetical protein